MHQIFTPNGRKWNVELISDWINYNLNLPFLHTLVVNNSTPTTVSASNTHYKVQGTFVVNPLSRGMTVTNGQFMHNNPESLIFEVIATVSVSAGNNQVIGLHVGKNGTAYQYTETLTTTSGVGKAENIVLKGVVELSSTDYLEIFLENKTAATNIVMSSASVVLKTI